MFGWFRKSCGYRNCADKPKDAARCGLSAAPRQRRVSLSVEQLEDRSLPSVANLTAYDQLLIELINRARANPSAEAAWAGVALNQGLASGTISTAAKQPLAPHHALVDAAGAHSDDMYARNYFNHTNLSGQKPWDRAVAHGYPTTYVGENIAWGTYGPVANAEELATIERHRNLFRSAGHRDNMLRSIYNEIGTGMTFADSPYQHVTWSGLKISLATENFGYRAGLVYLTGVAFTDGVVDNDFYNVGEGLGNVTVTATNQFGAAFTTTTAAAGGYALRLAPGTYTIRASGVQGQTVTVAGVAVGSQNVKLDFTPQDGGANHVPQLPAIPDQEVRHGQSVVIALAGSDADNDPLTYQAVIEGYSQKFELDRQLRLRYTGNYWNDYLGQREKWIYSDAQRNWYYVTPDGALWKANGGAAGQVIAQLDPSVHTNPSLLHSARAPQPPADSVDVDIAGATLEIAPAPSYVGSFRVRVHVSDGVDSAAESFVIEVKNDAPTLGKINDVQIRHGETLTVNLHSSDADGDPVNFSAKVEGYNSLHELDQQLGLEKRGGYFINWMNANEKWMYSRVNQQWYFLLPDGRLYAWTGGGVKDSILAATVNAKVIADPARLHDAAAPPAPAVDFAFNANRLIVDTPDDFVGSFKVTVTASDSIAATNRTFIVTSTNHAPNLPAIGDVTLQRSQTLTVVLNASDAEGDALSYQAAVSGYSLSYDLDQQYDFYQSGGTYFENWMGLGEKWVRSRTDGQWYFLLSDGRLFAWGGQGFATSTFVAQLTNSVHRQPTLLHAAAPPQTPAVTATLTGNLLMIDPADAFVGTFRVTVSVSDGVATTSRSFLVTAA